MKELTRMILKFTLLFIVVTVIAGGGTAANVALKHYSTRLKSRTYISTSCDVTKRTNAKVLLIGGARTEAL